MISKNFEKLFKEAIKVRERAYVPYSKFKVGVAFLTEDNSVVVGCNVENAAYPQSQCAEASAIGSLISEGFSSIKEVVVIGSGKLLFIRDSIIGCSKLWIALYILSPVLPFKENKCCISIHLL